MKVLTIIVAIIAIAVALYLSISLSVSGGSKVVGISGFVVILPFDEAVVRKILPSTITLGPQDVFPKGKHPVVFVFQLLDQEQPQGFMGQIPPFPFSYHEMIVAVPYTIKHDAYGDESLWFNAAMYVDLYWPGAFGKLLGFTKDITAIEELTKSAKSSYAVFASSDDKSRVLIQGIFHESDKSKKPIPYDVAKKALKASLEMPWITETISRLLYLRSDWNWGYQTGNSKIYPVSASVRVALPATSALAPLDGEYDDIKPISAANPFGAFAFNGSWTSAQSLKWTLF